MELKDFEKELNLTLSDKTLGASDLYGCTVWETEYKDVYLTDYNIDYGYFDNKEDANLLKSKGLIELFGRGKEVNGRMRLSALIFQEDIECIKNEIKEFAKSIK